MKKALSVVLILALFISTMPSGPFAVRATDTDNSEAAVTGGNDWQVVAAPITNVSYDSVAAVSEVLTADGSIPLVSGGKLTLSPQYAGQDSEMVSEFIATIEKNTGTTVPNNGQYKLVIGKNSAYPKSSEIYNEIYGARPDHANDYTILLEGTTVYIIGATGYALQNALDCFIELFAKDADGSIPAKYEHTHQPEHDTYTLAGNNIKEYTIRIEQYPSHVVRMAALTFQQEIIDKCGYILDVEPISKTAPVGHYSKGEIRIGPMNDAVKAVHTYDTVFNSSNWEEYYNLNGTDSATTYDAYAKTNKELVFETDGMLDADYGYYRIGFTGNHLAIEGGSSYAVSVGVMKALALLAKQNSLTAADTLPNGTYTSGFDYKNGAGYDAVDYSMTNGFGLVYAEEFDYTGKSDAEIEAKFKSKWEVDGEEDADPSDMHQHRPGNYGENWWVAADTAGNNYLFEVTKKRTERCAKCSTEGTNHSCWDSVRLVAENKWGFRYGLWETRLVMSTRNGACSSVWSNTYAPYSTSEPSHEIDVYENYGQEAFVPCLHAFHPDAETSHNFLFKKDAEGNPYKQKAGWVTPNEGENFYDTFHHVSVDWTYDYIKVYLDGELASELQLTDDLRWGSEITETKIVNGKETEVGTGKYNDEYSAADSYRNGQSIKLANGVARRGYCDTVPTWLGEGKYTEPVNFDGSGAGFVPAYWMNYLTENEVTIESFCEVQLVDYTRVYQTDNDTIRMEAAKNDIRFMSTFDTLTIDDEDGVATAPAEGVQDYEDCSVGQNLAISHSTNKATVTTDTAHTGSNSVKMVFADSGAATRPQVMVKDANNQQITVAKGGNYNVSFWVKLPADAAYSQVNYYFTATDHENLYTGGSTGIVPKDPEKIYEVNAATMQKGVWQKVEFTITDCPRSGNVRMGITGNKRNNNESFNLKYFYVDDLLITEAEPNDYVQSFEDAKLGDALSLGDAAITVTTDYSCSGTNAAKVESTIGSTTPQMILTDPDNQPITVESGDKYHYQLSFRVLAPDGGNIHYSLQTENGVVYQTSSVTVNEGEWQLVTASIASCPHSGTLQLSIFENGGATIYVDDIRVEERVSVTIDDAAMTFENGAPNNLSPTKDSLTRTIESTAEQVYTGSKAIKITTNDGTGNTRPQFNVTNGDGTVTVEAGKNYTLSFMVYIPYDHQYASLSYWAAAVSEENEDKAFGASTDFVKDKCVIAEVSTATLPSAGKWHQIILPIKNCKHSGILRVGITHGSLSSVTGSLYVDDIKLTEADTVTVTFDPAGGTVRNSSGTTGNAAVSQSVMDGTLVAYDGLAPQRDGYTFMGWYTTADYVEGTYFDHCRDTVSAKDGKTQTLYARWHDADHEYSGVCDTVCDECGDTRVAPDTAHAFAGGCDSVCDICGDIRKVSVEHTYDNSCDKDCNVCGYEREAQGHVFDNACDKDCNNNCGYEREVDDHKYDNSCDADCNECQEEREAPHNFSGDCDSECNSCDHTREASAEHTYDGDCDRDCDVCGDIRETNAAHTGTDIDGTHCEECGATLVAGDVNGDDKIDENDLSLLMRYLNGWGDTIVVSNADVNGDRKINNKDYVILMRNINN